MAIPQSFLDELKMSCDIGQVVSSYVQLRRSGRTSRGLCPFHSEKTPSFHVYHESQSFYCFGCGAGGDVISFIMRIENLGYIEALKFLAERAGIPFPEEERDDPGLRVKPLIYEINRAAAHYFHNILKSPAGEAGRRYLMGDRQLSAATVTKYGLGFAPQGWDNLRSYLRGKGYTDEQMLLASVVTRGRDGKSVYDTFRNRVVFPIIDLRKNVIGFGGRVMDDSKPKYLNSPDTPVFKKSRNLFSLNFAKNKADGTLILAEGYMDVIAMNQAGFENAVATLGTALTPEQARLMGTYCKEVVIAYDSDGPGRTATNRAVGLLDEAGVKTRVLDMKGAKDPDEFIKKFGRDRFRLLIDGARGATEYGLKAIREKYDLGDAAGKAGYLQEAADYLAGVPSAVEREIYAGKLAEETGVLPEVVRESVGRAARRAARRMEKKTSADLEAGRLGRMPGARPGDIAGDGVIGCLYHHPDWRAKIAAEVSPADFQNPDQRAVYETLLERQKTGECTVTELAGVLSQEQMNRLSGILARVSEGYYSISPEALADYIRRLGAEAQKKEIAAAGELDAGQYQALAEKIRREKQGKRRQGG